MYNSALMDLGALVCVPRKPKCGICPVQKFCGAKNPKDLPVKKLRSGTKRLTERHAFVVHQGNILLEQSDTRWRGMWILPRLHSIPANEKPIYKSAFPFTNHRIDLNVYAQAPRQIDPPQQEFSSANKDSWRWIKLSSLDSIAMPSPHRKAARRLLREQQQHDASGPVPSNQLASASRLFPAS